MPDAFWEVVLVLAVVMSWVWMYLHDRKVEDRLDDLAKVTNSTHELVNSKMGLILREHAELWRRTANATGTAGDAERAGQAEARSKEHDASQAAADARQCPFSQGPKS